MAASDDNVLSFAVPPPVPAAAMQPASTKSATARFSEGILARLGTLLAKAIDDAASIEVKTFTSSAADSALASTGDPLTQNMRMRAFTRVAFDGDTAACVPLKEGGAVDTELWDIHKQNVDSARADRARAIDASIAAVQKFAKAVR